MQPTTHKHQVTSKIIRLLAFVAGFLFVFNHLNATPQLSITDPAIIHTIYGVDKYYERRKNCEFKLHITPFYQHTKTASQQIPDNPYNGFKDGEIITTICGQRKVDIGNILGRWNILAMMYNLADPIQSNSALGKARTEIITAEGLAPTDSVTEQSGKNFTFGTTISDISSNVPSNNETKSVAGTLAKVKVHYEKIGIRGQTSFDFAFGLGMTIKSGLIDYRQVPKFIPFQPINNITGDFPAGSSAEKIASELTPRNKLETFAKQFNLDLCEQRMTTLEDTHVDIHWCWPVKCCDGEDYSYLFAPLLSLGVWIPTGAEKRQDQVFSVATGNDGFIGGTVEASLNFDFPDMLQFSFGGGVAFFSTRTLCDYRMPTNDFQVGMIPWKTTITRRPGEVWYANISMKSDEFDPGFSFFVDYIYTLHTRDGICIKEPNSNRKEQFEKALKNHICKTPWRTQNFNVGIKYNISPYCSLSLGAQGYISGVRTYRTTTVFGSFMLLI